MHILLVRMCVHARPHTYAYRQIHIFSLPHSFSTFLHHLHSLCGREGEADLWELHYSGFPVGRLLFGNSEWEALWKITGQEEGAVQVFTLLAPSLPPLIFVRPQFLVLSPLLDHSSHIPSACSLLLFPRRWDGIWLFPGAARGPSPSLMDFPEPSVHSLCKYFLH